MLSEKLIDKMILQLVANDYGILDYNDKDNLRKVANGAMEPRFFWHGICYKNGWDENYYNLKVEDQAKKSIYNLLHNVSEKDEEEAKQVLYRVEKGSLDFEIKGIIDDYHDGRMTAFDALANLRMKGYIHPIIEKNEEENEDNSTAREDMVGTDGPVSRFT